MYKQFFWKYNAEFIKSVIQDVIDSQDLNITCNMFCYHNDVCPSLLLESESQTYTLFLPNSWQNDGEETTKFTLIYDEDYAYREKPYRVLDTLQDVIVLLLRKRNKDLISDEVHTFINPINQTKTIAYPKDVHTKERENFFLPEEIEWSDGYIVCYPYDNMKAPILATYKDGYIDITFDRDCNQFEMDKIHIVGECAEIWHDTEDVTLIREYLKRNYIL